jgi:hypothetical protein
MKLDDVPTTNQFNALRTALTNRGVSTATLDTVLGTSVGGRTVRQILVVLLAWLRTLPKG